MVKTILFILLIMISVIGCNKKAETATDTTILQDIDPTFSAPTDLIYSGIRNIVLNVNQAMSVISPTFTAKSNIVLFRVSPALPLGLSLDPYTGLVSGLPLFMQDAKDYTLSVINNGGSSTYDITIKINDLPPTSLTYSQSKYSIQLGTDSPVISPNGVSGGAVVSYSLSPETLPAGMAFLPETGEIYGRPFDSLPERTYTVTAINSGGSTSTTLKLEVVGYPPSSLTYQQSNLSLKAGKDSVLNYPIYSGNQATSFTITPSLPDDLVLSSTTGILSGSPSIASNSSYTITATNQWGSTTSNLHILSLNYINGLSTGENHSCVLKNKYIYCFGKNNLKQLGATSSDICVDSLSVPTDCSKTPLIVKDFNLNNLKVKKIVSALNSNCVLTMDSKVACFGSNLYGQLGFGSNQSSNQIPTLVTDSVGSELTGVTDIQAGANHYCAKTQSKLYCWGDNQYGQLGNLIILSSNVAISVKSNSGDLISANFGIGMNHGCANVDSSLFCWGSNLYGQLSNNSQQSSNIPVESQLDTGLIYNNPLFIIGGGSYSIVQQGSNYFASGLNEYGELSNGTLNASLRGALIQESSTNTLLSVEKIVAGENSFCFIKDTKGYCVGRNDFNFGNLTNLNIANLYPIEILDSFGSNPMTDISELSNGYSSHRCLAKQDTVYCFGKNTFGQLGTDYADTIFPRIVVIP